MKSTNTSLSTIKAVEKKGLIEILIKKYIEILLKTILNPIESINYLQNKILCGYNIKQY